MKVQEIIQKIRDNSELILSKDQDTNSLSICLSIYNEIKDLPTDEFDSFLEAIEDEGILLEIIYRIERKIEEGTINKILLKKFLIQACLDFNPELNKDEQDIDKRINYLNKLINNGVNVNSDLHLRARAPLALAIMSNSAKIVEFLIKEKGANLQGEQIKYVLGLMDYNLETIKDEKADSINILHNVAKIAINDMNSDGCDSILDFMSENKIEFEPDRGGRSGKGIREVLSIISEINMRIFARAVKNKDKKAEDQAYELLALAIQNGLEGLAKKLINLGLDVNKKMFHDREGRVYCDNNNEDRRETYILHLAIRNGLIEIVKELLDRGANPNMKDHFRNNPLYYAVMSGRLEIVKLLIEKGASVNLEDNRAGALHYAAMSGRLEIVTELLDKRADPNMKDHFGKSSLHFAARDGHLEVVKELLDRGANPNILDRDGNTPLDLAEDNEIIQLLEAKAKVESQIPTKSDIPNRFVANEDKSRNR